MGASSTRGNNPELWEKLLFALDEKLQLGLLDRLKRVTSYHFEADILYLEPGTPDDIEYLEREAVRQHIELLAQDAVGIDKVKIKK